MSSVIKSYLSVILILVAVFTFSGIITVALDVQNARDYHASVINEIEISNHAESVILACKADASDNGYTLTTESYSNNSENGSNAQITKVVLKYSYNIDFLGLFSEKEISGYAR